MCERCVTHVRLLCLICIGPVTNVALWCAWTATKPAKGKVPKVRNTLTVYDTYLPLIFCAITHVYAVFLRSQIKSCMPGLGV